MAVRLSVEAKNALSLAKLEAKRYNLVYIGTELVLLALVEERGSVSQRIFEEYGIDPHRLRQEVESNVLMGEQPLRPGQVIRAAPLVRRVVELAQEESERLRSPEVTNCHLLLALLRERNGVAAEVIDNLRLDRAELREHVLARLRGEVGTGSSTEVVPESGSFRMPQRREPRVAEESPAEVLDSAIVGAEAMAMATPAGEEGPGSDMLVEATALVLRGLCEKYASLKGQGLGEAELLDFLKSVLKGRLGALVK
jgi:ATP-dependent Clp protease ATP-binding subunit ClpC